MDNPLSSAIQKMGGNFLVAALTPSMAFILCVYISFQPLLEQTLGHKLVNPYSFIESGIIFLLASTILGFTIYTIGIYIYKAFEGYVFILGKKGQIRDLLLKKHRLQYRKTVAKRQHIQKQLSKINGKIQKLYDNPRFNKWYNKQLSRLIAESKQLNEIKYNLTAYLDHNYPPSESYVMPTRFGNILRAAELYSSRYGIDAVALWGKTVSAIPTSNSILERIDDANNQCQFLLNGALLGMVFSALCMISAIVTGTMWLFNLSTYGNEGKLFILYIILMILAIIIARFFYEASLFNVEQFGEMIRTTYDLGRFNLLEALHIELPNTLADEKKIWRKLSHFATGNLDYREKDIIANDSDFFRENTIDIIYSHRTKKT